MRSALNHFLYRRRREIYNPIGRHFQCGYQDGACFILAEALRSWLGGNIACLVRESMWEEQTADHFLLSIGGFYIDSDGVHMKDELIAKWNRFEARNGKTLIEDPYDPARFMGILQHKGLSEHLAEQLKKHFGTPATSELRNTLGSPAKNLLHSTTKESRC